MQEEISEIATLDVARSVVSPATMMHTNNFGSSNLLISNVTNDMQPIVKHDIPMRKGIIITIVYV